MTDRAEEPMVSVVIPAHGRRELLAETLESLFAQTLRRWEAVVVIDDDSQDMAGWVRGFVGDDARVRVIVRQGDKGGANVCRNLGVASSVARYVVFLDSDDLLEPDCLWGRTRYLDDHPQLDFTVHAMRCFRTHPGDTDLAWNTLTDEDDFERYLRLDGPWQTSCATWRRSALDRIGPWDPDLLSLQDLDYHVRAIAAGLRYEKINAWDCHYRLPHKRKSISDAGRSIERYRSHVRIADRLLALPDAVLDATPDRRPLLAGFCFHIATCCANKGDLPAGLALWNWARRRGIAGGRSFAEGVAMLLGEKLPALGKPLRRSLLARWPETHRMVFRHTFLTAPLPVQASVERSAVLECLTAA